MTGAASVKLAHGLRYTVMDQCPGIQRSATYNSNGARRSRRPKLRLIFSVITTISPMSAVQLKDDRSPVTIADTESEKAIKQILSDAFPDDGFFGEETGESDMDAEYVWLVDPLDGTKSFVRGYPFFSVQIALMHAGEIVARCFECAAIQRSGPGRKGAGRVHQRRALCRSVRSTSLPT